MSAPDDPAPRTCGGFHLHGRGQPQSVQRQIVLRLRALLELRRMVAPRIRHTPISPLAVCVVRSSVAPTHWQILSAGDGAAVNVRTVIHLLFQNRALSMQYSTVTVRTAVKTQARIAWRAMDCPEIRRRWPAIRPRSADAREPAQDR